MWQYIIVYIIGFLTLLYMGVKSYRFFRTLGKTEVKASCACTGCPGCRIKNPKECNS